MLGAGYIGGIYLGGWLTTTGVLGGPTLLTVYITFDPVAVVNVLGSVTVEDSATTAVLSTSMT